MARILILLITLAISLPVLADEDEDKTEGNRECAHEANKRDLSGKERKRFMKECHKEARHDGRPGDRIPTAQPAAPPKPAASQPPQKQAQAKPMSEEEKRNQCNKEADNAKLKLIFRTKFMKDCMAR